MRRHPRVGTARRTFAGALLATALAACGGDPPEAAADADEPQAPAPPKGAKKLDLDRAAPGATPEEGGGFLLAGVEAGAFARVGGSLVVGLRAGRYRTELFCDDFGCKSWWRTRVQALCFSVPDLAPATGPACDAAAAEMESGSDPPDEQAVLDALAAVTALRRPEIKIDAGINLEPAASGAFDWLGAATVKGALDEQYGDWVTNGLKFEGRFTVRVRAAAGAAPEAPLVDFAPGGVDFAPYTYPFRDNGRASLVHALRGDALVAISSTPGPVSGHFAAAGYSDPLGGRVVAAAVVDGTLHRIVQLVAPRIKPNEEASARGHPAGAIGGGWLYDLHLVSTRAETGADAPLVPFSVVQTRGGFHDSLLACFNRPLRTPGTIVSDRGLQLSELATTAGGQCVRMRTSAQDAVTAYTLSLSGFESAFGEKTGVVRAPLWPSEGPAMDVLEAFTGIGASGCQSPCVARGGTFVPTARGGLVIHNSETGEVVEVEPDLVTMSHPLPRGTQAAPVTVRATAPDPLRRGLWVLYEQAGSRRLLLADGDAHRTWTQTDIPELASTDRLWFLGEGSLLVKGGSSIRRLLPDGSLATFIGPGIAPEGLVPIRFSDDVMLNAGGGAIERWSADGRKLGTWTFPEDPWAGVSSAVLVDGVLYASNRLGFFRMESDGKTKLSADICTTYNPWPAGGIFAWCPGGSGTGSMLLREGQVSQIALKDPFYSTPMRELQFPVVVGERVFAWAAGQYHDAPLFPAALRVFTRAAWDRLVEEAR